MKKVIIDIERYLSCQKSIALMRLAYPKKEKGKEKQPNKLFVSLTLMVY